MRVLHLLFHLATCVKAQTLDLPPPSYNEAIDKGDNGPYPTRSYKTIKEEVKVPVANFLKWSPECDDGMVYFITPRGRSLFHKSGPMILGSRGELIWTQHFDNRFHGGQAYNFQVQPYRGEDHLTFWIGEDRIKGHGAGQYYLLNSSYDLVDKYEAAEGRFADLHEFLVTDDNTALMSVYQSVPRDVSMFRTFKPKEKDPNYVWDSLIQEIDLRTHRLKWQWRATDHVDLNETYRPIGNVDGTKKNQWDWLHLNSAQKDEFGNYLISARFPHSIYYVDGKTKKTLWQLGGKKNTFMDLSDGNATNFAFQHHARLHSADAFPNLYTPVKRPGFTTKLLTMFDNAAENVHYHYGLPLSRGLLLELTYPTPGTKLARSGPQKSNSFDSLAHGSEDSHISKPAEINNVEKIKAINGSDPNYTVRVIMSYENPDRIRSSSQGSMQIIPQGPREDFKILVGYGLAAAWTEFASNGTVLCDVHFGAKTSFETGQIQSYRVYKQKWTGRPNWKPKALIDLDLYVTWLGATDVVEWLVQYSPTKTKEEQSWTDVLRLQKTKFEETIVIPKGLRDSRYLRVVALDKKGARMENGVSDPVYRGFLAARYPWVYDLLPRIFISRGTWEITAILAVVIANLFVIYQINRRCWKWRIRRPNVWPFSPRGALYQRLESVESY